jgi:L-alanine-DL-glutamate epimerase-like enolase superfamily enzyme
VSLCLCVSVVKKNMKFNRRAFLKTSAAVGATALLAPKIAEAQINSASNSVLSPISGVKIKDVKTYKLPQAIFVQVVADNGVSGWGEASPNNRHLVETFIHNGIKENVVGKSVWNAEPVWDDMFYDNHDLGPGGVLTYAIAGVDCALWDLRGKLTKMPVYRLLGGKYRDRVRAYGSFGVNGGQRMSADEAARKAAKFVERGFTVVKLRMQIRERNINPNPDPTLEYARAVRRAVGDKIEFFVDINNGYTAARAIEMGKRLRQEIGVNYYEEPVSTQNLHELAQVCDALDFPVIAGEKEYTRWQHRDLIERGKVGIINPDVVKCGGLTEAKKIAAFAQACSRQIVPHNTKPTLSTAAALHFAASISNCGAFMEFVDVDEFRDLMSLMKQNVVFKDGFLEVPQTAGLGIEPDEERLKRSTVNAEARTQ